jgi:hypothetical protein
MLKPEKLKDLSAKIKECIENEKYILTKHALDRQNERFINLPETLYVLKTGMEDKSKTVFDKANNKWKYAIKVKH